jgi:hypothetical protein
MFCHLPRYRPAGPGMLDALYGKGYVLHLLHEGSVREFLLGFYAYLAFNLDHDTLVSRESNALYPSDLHQRASYPSAEITDPLPSASAVLLHFVRHMLVTEERAEAGTYSGNLLLLTGAPRAWLQDNQQLRIRQMPTQFGSVSLAIRSRVSQGRIEAHVVCPQRMPCKTIKLRLPHPEGRGLLSVQCNGEPWNDFDRQGEWIRLPGNGGTLHVEATYEERVP